MSGRHKDTPWTKIVAGLAALKVIPFKKALFGIAAIAGAAYAYNRLSNDH